MKRLYSLKKRVIKYVQNIYSICRSSDKAKKAFDKPNVHRLLEFYAFIWKVRVSPDHMVSVGIFLTGER